MHAHGRDIRGFTLIEQIITLAVAAIATGMAIPAMRGLLHRHRARTATQAITTALHAARMLSIERQRRVVLCPSDDGHRCDDGGAWGRGWLIGIDRNHDGQPDGKPFYTHTKFAGMRILASRGRSRVYYHPNGSAPGSNLTLRICPREDLPQRIDAVVVSNSGRIRQERLAASSCR